MQRVDATRGLMPAAGSSGVCWLAAVVVAESEQCRSAQRAHSTEPRGGEARRAAAPLAHRKRRAGLRSKSTTVFIIVTLFDNVENNGGRGGFQ